MSSLRLKRGDTFLAVCNTETEPPQTLEQWALWGIASSVRSGGQFIANLIVEKSSTTPMQFSLTCAQTQMWPISDLQYDIKFTLPSGQIIRSPTGIISVEESQTK